MFSQWLRSGRPPIEIEGVGLALAPILGKANEPDRSPMVHFATSLAEWLPQVPKNQRTGTPQTSWSRVGVGGGEHRARAMAVRPSGGEVKAQRQGTR